MDIGRRDNANAVCHPREILPPRRSGFTNVIRYPPIVHARIQSIARPDLSAAIGGLAALPRIYLNVAGVPNDPGSESQKWRLDYFLPIDKD